MKKRILCALLICCMLLALVPTALFPASAAGEGTGSGASGNAASTADDFADLYIGADGSKTQNGGSLTVLLTAFRDVSSVNLLAGAWTNVAPGATQNATLGGTWEKAEDGSIGYDLEKWDWNYTLSLDATLLPTDTYTLEIISSVRGLTVGADGKTPIERYAEPTRENISLGRFRGFLWSGNSPWPPRNYNALVTMLYDGAAASDYTWGDLGNLDGIGMGSYMQAYREDTSVMSLTVNLTESPDSYTYEFLKNGETAPSRTLKTTCAKGDTPYVGNFVLGQAMPASYYAVRLYTKPLTAKELTHNRALDILLYIGFSFADYKAVPDADKSALLSAVAEAGFSVTVGGVKDIIDELAAMRAVEALARQKTEYDKLYVGADGSKTQNGGSLSILLSAYDTASVMFFDNKTVWYDKMGNFDGTLIGSLWQKREGGGVGYDMTYIPAADSTAAATGTYTEDVYLNLGIDALPREDFTLEHVTKYGFFGTDDGKGGTVNYTAAEYLKATLSDAIGQLKVVYNRGGNDSGDAMGGVHYCRWFLAPGTEGFFRPSYTNRQLWGEGSRGETAAYSQQIIRNLTVTNEKTLATYQILQNNTLKKQGDYDSTVPSTNESNTYYVGSSAESLFYLFRRAPVTTYAVRVYDAVLTEYEMAYNHFVDMLAYAGADIKALTDLDAESQAFVVDSFKKMSMMDKDAFDKALKETLALLDNTWSADSSLYVTDGLEVLLAAYDGFSSAYRISESGVVWANAVSEGTFGTLVGKGWYRAEDGGLKIRDTVPQLIVEKQQVKEYRVKQANDFYLSFDYGMLPDGEYTLESIVDPEGITVEAEDGTISRFYDDYTVHGIFTEDAFVLGAYRCMGFVCYSHAGGANMQRRWMYQSYGNYNSNIPAGGRVEVGKDNTFGSLNFGNIVNYSIAYNYIDEEETYIRDNVLATYTVALDNKVNLVSEISPEIYMTNDEVIDRRFDMWRNMAGTYYSIRVYNRLLSEAEKLQNRVADVCYYLDLDTSMLEETLSKIPDKTTVFKAFSHFNFNMTREEAQSDLDNGMAGIWVLSEEVAVKKDMSDALRFYFTLQQPSITAIMQAGFAIELGTVVNLSGEQPDVKAGKYDYRFVAFDSVAGAHKEYFLDEDTYAVTLSFHDGNIDLYNQNLKVVTYVKLTTAQGEEMYFYGGFSGKAFYKMTSFFTVMNYLDGRNAIKESELAQYVADTVASCYYDHTVYFDSNAEGKGDGSADAPYTDFADAFAACNAALAALDRPTNVRLFVEGGTHTVTEIAEFDFTAVTYPYYYYTIEGDYLDDEAPELTTAIPLPTEEFEAVAGKDSLYVYQFAPDAEGKYPAFRNLYVDGITADLSHSTANYAHKGVMPEVNRFGEFEQGTYLKAKYYYENGVLEEHSPSVEYASLAERTDLIASYTTHYNGFLSQGNAYVWDPGEDYKPAVLYLNIASVEALRDTVSARLAEMKANKDAVSAEVAELTAEKATAKAAYEAAVADYEAKLAAAGKAGATDEEKVAYVAAKAVMDAAKVTLDEVTALLAETELMVYDPTFSYQVCMKGTQLEMYHSGQWCYNLLDVYGIDFDDVTYYYDEIAKELETCVAVYIRPDHFEKFQRPKGGDLNGYFFSMQNDLAFVDSENEYYYDVETGRLYYYTAYGLDGLSISYPTLDNLFVFHNPQYLVLTDLTIWGVDIYELSRTGVATGQAGADVITEPSLAEGGCGFCTESAISLYDPRHTTVQDCYIHDIGGAGIFIQGRNEYTTISGNELEWIGDSGIRVRGDTSKYGGREMSETSGSYYLTVTNNYLHDIGRSIYSAPSVMIGVCENVEISRNTVIGSSYSAYSIGWKWTAADWEEGEKIHLQNVNMHHNYITDYMQELGDGGAIYIMGGNLKSDNPKQLNFLHHNYVVHSKSSNPRGFFACSYYFDASCSNWSNYNNILVKHASTITDKQYNAGRYTEAEYYAYLSAKYTRPFFMQSTTPDSLSFNIHSWDNYVYNVRATKVTEQFAECYHMGSGWKGKGHTESGTQYFSGERSFAFSASVKIQIEECGAYACPGDWTWVLGDDY
ncbi:MAG: right-handed parallel beta-helix repeat-containing protein [Clostridia bacterium]|nr:right-handed parallel beta-helix repeat-containing protein [Clostridia bacterium]